MITSVHSEIEIHTMPEVWDYKFDRKTFDPVGNYDHEKILSVLRMNGRKRRWWYGGRGLEFTIHGERHLSCCSSPSLRALRLPENGRGVFVDFGCGDSGDAIVASSWGYEGIGIDLFPPSPKHSSREWVEQDDLAPFIRADVAEAIPLPNDSVIAASSHAMIDLVEPAVRNGFYNEAHRVLKKGGLFALCGVKLTNGYGFNAREEIESILKLKFRYVRSTYAGCVVVKA